MKSTLGGNSFMYRLYMTALGTGVSYNNWFTATSLAYPFTQGEWFHIAATFDGSEVRFYVDGALESVESLSATIGVTALDLTIGADHPGILEIFNGAMDDVRIYSRVLEPGEIAQLAGNDPTAVGETGLPAGMVLGAASPNPTRSATALPLSLDTPAVVRATVHDVTGRQVRTLLEGRQPAGTHTLAWDGRDAAGTAVAGGAYYLRLETPGGAATRALVVLR
jgi:hypothetical protein